MYIKVHALRSYSAGDISYMMMDPNEIKTFSSSLKADFVKVDAKAHNVPLNPLVSANNIAALVVAPDSPAELSDAIINFSLNQPVGSGSAGVFDALIEASGAVPAFALKSEDNKVGLNSNALTELKTNILTRIAELAVTSTSAKAKVEAPQSEVNFFCSGQTKVSATGKLNISSMQGTKIDCGPTNSIEIKPTDMNLTSTMLDMQTTTLQMKADATLKIQVGAAQLETKLFNTSGDVANISTQLTKVG